MQNSDYGPASGGGGTIHSLAERRARRHVGASGLTKRQLAAELGVSERTIERWASDGCPAFRPYGPGLLVRYHVAEVRFWLRARSGRLPALQAKEGRWDAALGLVRVEAPPVG